MYTLIRVFVLNIQASLYKDIACHRSEDDKPDNSTVIADGIEMHLSTRAYAHADQGVYFPQTHVTYSFNSSMQRGKLT